MLFLGGIIFIINRSAKVYSEENFTLVIGCLHMKTL